MKRPLKRLSAARGCSFPGKKKLVRSRSGSAGCRAGVWAARERGVQLLFLLLFFFFFFFVFFFFFFFFSALRR